MEKVYELIHDPILIVLTLVIAGQFKIILKLMDIVDRNGIAIAELTTWIKTKFSGE